MSRCYPHTTPLRTSLILAMFLASLVPPIPVFAAQVSADSLVGYWKLDETSGTSAADSSGDGNTGTHTNGPTISTTVPSTISFTNARSLSFDGTDDYVDTPDDSSSLGGGPLSFDDSNNFSLSLWYKGSDTATGTSGHGKTLLGRDSGDIWANFVLNGGNVQYRHYNGGWQTITSLNSIADNAWHHVVYVNHSNATGDLYVDGVANVTGASSALDDGARRFVINNFMRGYNNLYTSGLLDDVRIYKRALSQTEIADLAAGRHIATSWKGNNSTAFENAGNWSGSYIPDPYSRVTVQFRANQPTLTGAVQFAGLTINTGASLKTNGTGITMKDSGVFTNYGTLITKGNETFTSLTNDARKGTVLVYGTGSYSSLPTGLSYYNLNLNDGLLAYWRFDETSGTRAADSSGYGYSGSLIGGATISTTVAPTRFTNPRSLSFDGSDDYVDIGNISALNFERNSPFTTSAWVNMSSMTFNYRSVVGKTGTANDKGWWFVVTGTQEGSNNSAVGLVLISVNSSNDLIVYSPNSSLTTGWHHIAASYTGSSNAAGVTFYIDGVRQATQTVRDGLTTSIQTSASVQIGQRNVTGSPLSMNGFLDDVRIYNRALSAAEISALAVGSQPSTASGTVTLNGNLTVAGNLTLNGGTLDLSSSNYSITLSGSLLNNGGKITSRRGTITLDGNDAAKVLLTGGQRLHDLSIVGNGSWTLHDRLIMSGALAISAGTLDAGSGSYAIHAQTVNQTAGTIIPRAGVIVLNGSTDQTVRATSTLKTLRIEDPTENGLIGYWKFDELSGTVARDSSGNNNHGTRSGTGTVWSGSSLNTNIMFTNSGAIRLNGSNDYFDTTSSSVFAFGTGDFTWSIWINPDNFSRYQHMLARDGDQSTGALKANVGDGVIYYYSTAFTTYGTITAALQARAWNHVVLVRNSNVAAIYLNGVLQGTKAGFDDNFSSSYFRFGNGWPGEFTDGAIDDIRIYNRALSVNEVANLYRGRYASGNSGVASFTLGNNLSVGTLALDSGDFLTSSSTLTVTNALQLLRGNGNITLGSVTTTLNGGLTLSGSKLTGNAGTLDINGHVQVLTGTLIAPSGTMTISGNWNKTGGVFTHNSGTVQFDGTLQTLSGSQVFYNLTKTVSSADTFKLAWNGTQSVSGALTLRGQSSNLLTLRSTLAGTKAGIILDGDTGTQTIDYLNVADNTAAGGLALVCLAASEGCVNSGNTTNWQILSPQVYFLSGSLTKSETSGTASLVINLSGSSLLDITIPFSIAGTATGTGSDYTILSPTPLILQAGETSTGIIIRFENDSAVEVNETIILTLGTPTNAATGSTGALTVTLTSDDTAASSAAGTTTAQTQTGGGGGGYRGSSETMKEKIAAAQKTILARYQQQLTGKMVVQKPAASSRSSSASSAIARSKPSRRILSQVTLSSSSAPALASSSISSSSSKISSSLRSRSASSSQTSSVIALFSSSKTSSRSSVASSRKSSSVSSVSSVSSSSITVISTSSSAPRASSASSTRVSSSAFSLAPRNAEREVGSASSSSSPPGTVTIADRRGKLSVTKGDKEIVYRDVVAVAWYAPYVSMLLSEGIADGYKDSDGNPTGVFGVEKAVTYAEALKMALEAAGKTGGTLPPPRNTSARGTWASSYVKHAEDLGISVFTPELDVHSPASRGAVTQILMEALGFPIGKTKSSFFDVPEIHPYGAAIALAHFYGFITGDTTPVGEPTNRFRPDAPIIRAEVAKIIALAREVLR